MIISRSPLRISLGGGGTDLPSYFMEHGGYCISAAINKYVYVSVSRPFNPGITLKYSQIERVERVNDVNHPIIRESLKLLDFKTPQIEISSVADVPTGTGLGSSGSFTTGLLKALYSHRKKSIHSQELAELACHIEIDKLSEPIGKQDQYIAAFGGITEFEFLRDGNVKASPVPIAHETMVDLEENLLLFFTGFSRSASSILQDQNERSTKNDSLMLNNLHFIKEIGFKTRDALISGDTKTFGSLMHEHWEQKRKRSSSMSNVQIDEWYAHATSNGALGGKLVGAGGGGFLMFYAPEREKLRTAMRDTGLEELRIGFDFEGTKVILS
jgi:D-glycero-alpha-D-manno-heptose-7-phosphate kinase